MTDMYAPQTDPIQQESVEQENAMAQSESTEKQLKKTDKNSFLIQVAFQCNQLARL